MKAYQVCADLNENNRKREIHGLVSAMKGLSIKEGMIITLNQSELIESDGFKIEIVPVSEWFLN